MDAVSTPLWFTRDAADDIAAQARRTALETLSAALPAWPAARREALLQASQTAWGVSPVTASGLLAGNASAIAAAYSLRGKIAGVLLMASPDNGPLVCVGMVSRILGEKMNCRDIYWIDFAALEAAE